MEDPARPAGIAHILWTAPLDPDVLTVVARPARRRDHGLDLTAFGTHAAIVAAEGCEHVAIGLSGGCLRLDVIAGTMREGPVRLYPSLPASIELGAKFDLLRQLALIGETGPAAPWRIASEPRLERLVLALRVLDARLAGASLREIAIGLASPRTIDWPGDGESTKSWARRLVALADALARAGPRGVLGRTI